MTIFEKRFSFIDDKVLRYNMAMALQHATDLIVILDKYPSSIKSNFCKTVIIYTASIIEAALHFCLRKTLNPLQETEKWKYESIQIIYNINSIGLEPCKEVIGGIRKKEIVDLNDSFVSFQNILRICLREKILDEKLYNQVDLLRKLRNRQHLIGIFARDNGYAKRELNKIFNTAHRVLEIVEKRLSSTK